MLEKPFLAGCADRGILPQQHPTSGTPDDWFHNDLFATVGLRGISFDFFVNWRNEAPTVTPVIWIKRLLRPEHSYTAFLENINQVVTDEFGTDYLVALCAFANKYDLAVQLVVFKDTQDWSENASEVCIVDIGPERISFTGEVINLGAFKGLIQTYSGGAVSVGTKGLIYGTSRLECALSHTNAAYPGDMDLLVVNEESAPVLIMEFKKDTKGGPIDSQRLSNYYPSRDKRKYDRLAIFRNFLQAQARQIPVAVVYYPTSAAITQVKIELIKGEPGALETMASNVFNKNQTGDHSGSASAIKAIVDKHYTW